MIHYNSCTLSLRVQQSRWARGTCPLFSMVQQLWWAREPVQFPCLLLSGSTTEWGALSCIVFGATEEWLVTSFYKKGQAREPNQCSSFQPGPLTFFTENGSGTRLPLLYMFIYTGGSQTHSVVWGWIGSLLSWTFNALWVLPLFVLSKIINSLWFQVSDLCSNLHPSPHTHTISSFCCLF